MVPRAAAVCPAPRYRPPAAGEVGSVGLTWSDENCSIPAPARVRVHRSAGNTWLEPLGSYGLGYSDMEQHDELAVRIGALNGQYGTAQEYGGGLNWYLHETRQNRLTVEGLYINSSPTLNYIYPYRAGFTGMAIQTQYLVVF